MYNIDRYKKSYDTLHIENNVYKIHLPFILLQQRHFSKSKIRNKRKQFQISILVFIDFNYRHLVTARPN